MKKKILVLLAAVLCIANTVPALAAENVKQRGTEICSNHELVYEGNARATINVTSSDVFYGWQLHAEGRLLCIEGEVTAKERHYTKTTMQHKNTGSVYAMAYKEGTNKVEANKYGIEAPKNADAYEGRVFYGAA